jgi:hypothetical protein
MTLILREEEWDAIKKASRKVVEELKDMSSVELANRLENLTIDSGYRPTPDEIAEKVIEILKKNESL